MNSGQDVINSVLNSGLTLHGSQALSVSLAGTLTNTASLSAGKTRVTDTDGSTGEGHEGSTVDDHHVKEADFMSKDLMEQHFSHAAERMAQTDTERRPARKKAKLQSQSDVELQNA
ncbi:hypothetical protein DPMN_009108 [Dreissena polymorpha]|uniref:Uncharacterized protein n=2 Tax=Dreissena polymorpha TaxID=45954 RepID=A0A9D4RXX7_DREPO|nr:hypothetical protein DPMN_009108 [Dreissena polymorpha]